MIFVKAASAQCKAAMQLDKLPFQQISVLRESKRYRKDVAECSAQIVLNEELFSWN